MHRRPRHRRVLPGRVALVCLLGVLMAAQPVVAAEEPIVGAMAIEPEDIDRHVTFDGSTQRAFATSPAFDIVNDFSFSAWVRHDTTCPGALEVCRVMVKERAYGVYGQGGFWKYQFHNGSSWTEVLTNVPIRAGEWTHLALTRDKATGEVVFYVDGSPRHTSTYSSALGTSTDVVSVGGYHEGSTVLAASQPFNGDIDEVRLWSVVRTGDQLRADMHTWGPTDATGLVGYWDFNETSNATALNLATGSASASASASMSLVNRPAKTDVKSISTASSNTVVTFPRSYLTAAGGWRVPSDVTSLTYLVVAGGGGGGGPGARGNWNGGGGGGGQVRTGTLAPLGSYFAVTVGRGGAGGATAASAVNAFEGGDSVLGSIVSRGGGYGGSAVASTADSGGVYTELTYGPSGTATGGGGGAQTKRQSGATGSLFSGGNGFGDTQTALNQGGGGGAGAAANGSSASTGRGGAGGAGAISTITGSSVSYGGGGGGGTGNSSGNQGAGGAGGGGAGGSSGLAGAAGSINTGGGGGGVGGGSSAGKSGGSGGSGVVIVSFSTANNTCESEQTNQGAHVVVAFKVAGTCTWPVPSGVGRVDYLVVAGGGGGGSRAGGGGGAGGYMTATDLSLSGVSNLSITVGAGGAGAAASSNSGTAGSNGANSVLTGDGSFSTVTAIGGGGGGKPQVTAPSGGSGGGASGGVSMGTSATVGSGTAGQGTNGGTGSSGTCGGTDTKWCAGGGGGAGAVGGNFVANGAAGSGGAGRAPSWLTATSAQRLGIGEVSGSAAYFAGGGGGGTNTGGTAGLGGVGGGGNGSEGHTNPGQDATAHTGGGGGGSGYAHSLGQSVGGNGGSGVVVLRYLPATTCVGVESYVENSYTVVAFKSVQTNCTWTIPAGVTTIDYLVVAGGGGGGFRHGGGGGAGGYLTATAQVVPGRSATITVGAGGTGGSSANNSGKTNGGDSQLSIDGRSVALAIGGGTEYLDGGSGGGSPYGGGAPGNGTSGQGNNGGRGASDVGAEFQCTGSTTGWCGGGGGGAGAPGENADSNNNNRAGNGGAGATTTLLSATAAQTLNVGQVSGGQVYFAGGGGGGVDIGGTAGLGGLGGGANGVAGSAVAPSAAPANTGGGGAGGGYSSTGSSGGGNGGSGVVLIRFAATTSASSIDSAAVLNGTSQYFEVAEGTEFVSRATYTVESWINPTSTACPSSSFCPFISHDGDYVLSIAENQITAYVYHTGTGFYDTWVTGVKINANEWQHVALVRDGAAARLYVNGQLRASRTLGGSTRSTYSNQFKLWFGRHYTRYFAGQIDQARVWSTARTDAQIAAAMHEHTPSTATGLVAQYDFNGVVGTTVTNTAPSAVSGTNLTAFGSPTYRDVKSTSFVGSDVVVTFPRSYLTSADGWSVPTGINNARALVLAGGGGGGSSYDNIGAGGGGAGGLIDRFTSNGVEFDSGTVRVTVGAGGFGAGPNGDGSARSQWQITGNKGQNSVLGSLVAEGGGAGGGRFASGASGGSGGGGGGRFASSTGGTATAGQGNMGGRPTSDGSQGAGGGGAGGAGGDSNGTTVGAAGAGLDLSISGQSVTYAAGGAGGQRASNVTSAPSAGANSGGGGTGGNGVGTGTVGGYGGDGGSGVVIVRYSVVPECAPVTSRTGVYVVTKFVVAGECSWNVPTGVTSLDYLVVGGGGGGGAFLASGGASAGGGGAGGVLDGSALVVSPGQSLFVTVGEGGAGGEVTSSGGSPGASGGDSSLSGTGVATITAVGGGYGAGGNVTTADYHGGSGGSGGGALGSSYLSGIGGTGVAGPPRQGYDGGTNSGGCNYRPGGGGGGAGAVGGSAICTVSVTAGGAGGAGRAISITGTSLFYGGGGGAGGHGYVNTGVDPGAGGLGGGGAGGGISGVPGIDGLGGGGGGAGYISGVNATATGGDGGRGVVIVRHVDRVITKVAGDNQTGTANSTAGVNPKVRVVDAAGNGIDGVTVSFAAGLNSGSAGSATVVTSGGGYAETTWTFGAAASHTLTATMSLAGPNSTSFAATVSSSYAVTYDANGGAGAPVQTSENIGSTVTVSLTAPTRTGYTFSSWNTVSDGSGTQYAPGATFTMPNNAVTLYAQWTLNSHSLIYDANGGSGAPSTSSANYGTTVTLAVTRPTRVGHTFTGWNTVANGSGTGYVWDGTVFTPSSFTMGDANVTLYAQWSVNSYTVTYDANGGTGAPSAQTESYNSTVTVSSSVPTRAGHTFTGWNTAVNGSGTSAASGSSFTMGDANVTLYAQWNLNTHTVTYDANGGTGAPGSATGNYGSTVNVSATRPTRTGHTFTGWNTAANGSGTGHAWSGSVFTPATFTLTADVTLFAQWSVNSYTVTYDANGGSGAPSSQSTDYNTSITVTTVVPTRAGHTFTGWNTAADGTGSDYSANTSLLVTANVTLFAKWVVQTFSISYDANGGAGAPSTASGIAFGAATSISATVPTRAGYTFSSWNTAADGSGTAYANGESVTMPANNISLFAQWTATIQTVTYDANGGSGAPSDDTVATDATVTVSSSVPTRDGYTFLRWNTAANGSGVDRSSGSTFTMGPTNVTLYAVWLANTYSITYDANGGMSPPASSNAQTDSTVTVPGTTPTRAGYTFSSWNTVRNGSGAHLLPGATFTMPAGATTLFAQWSANANNLVYNANGGTGGPATIVATTDSSVTVSGSIPTRAGYTFSSWNSAVDGSGMTYAAGTTFTMPTTHLTLFAQWTVSTFQVLYDANGGSGAPAATNGTYQSVVNLTSVAPTRSGYTFLGWGTVVDGSGTNHAAGGAFVVPARNTTLYAVWVADVNDVYYVVNGGLGGPDASVAATGTAVPLPLIRPTREGHNFVGWNTAANGTGTGYTWNGSAFTPASFTMPGSDVFLFAQWSVNSYTVTYDANGGSGTVPAAQTDQFRASITLAASSLTRSGWSFVGWNTAADGTGVQWATGATYGIGSSNVTLYAEWNRNVNALIFDPLGGSSAPDVRFGATGTNVILPTSVPVREGHTFLGWEDSNQTALSPGDPYTMPITSVTLFARWSINSYALTYDVNGGIGSVPSAQNIEYASSVTVSGSIPTRAGYTFSSWNTAVDGSGTAYASGDTFSMPAASLTLFAQWTEAPVPTTTTVPTTVTPTVNEGSPAARTPKPVEQPNSSGGGQSVNDTTTTTTPPTDESDVDEPVVDESDVDEPAEPTSGNGDQSGWLWILMTGLVLLAGAWWFVRARRVK